MEKKTRTPRKFEYKNKMLTYKQIMNLEECTCSMSHLSMMQKEGQSIEDIISKKGFNVEEKRAIQKAERDQKARDKATIKRAKAEQQRLKAIDIMSVPVAEKSTYVYYVLKSYTHRADSFMSEPIRLTKGGGY